MLLVRHKALNSLGFLAAKNDSGTEDVCHSDDLQSNQCDSTGSRVPILPGTDSTGSYRVLLLYTTVRLLYRRSHLQRPLRS